MQVVYVAARDINLVPVSVTFNSKRLMFHIGPLYLLLKYGICEKRS